MSRTSAALAAITAGVALTFVPAAAAAPSVSTLTTVPMRGAIAARGTVVALTQIDGEQATLLIGKGGSLPVAAPATKTLPAWGQPHIGRDAERRPVVVYPHCTDVTRVKTCDLRAYDVLAGTDAPVAGVNKAGVGETEGAMDRGAVAFTRWTRSFDPAPASLAAGGAVASRTTLLYRAVGQPARVLTRQGGEQIMLDRGRVVQVRDTDPAYGLCGLPTVEVVRVDGGPRRTLESHGCGLNSQTILAPTFVGSSVIWAVRGIDDLLIERTPAAGGTVATAKVPGGFAVAAPTARSGATLLDGDWLTDPDDAESAESSWELKRVIGLDFS